MSLKRAIRAILVGTLTWIFGVLYLPQCGLRIDPQIVTVVSIGFAGLITFFIYRYS